MIDQISETGTHRENFESKNVRFLAHNFLKNVTFNGEPVVPVILSEGDDNNELGNNKGKHFLVEELGGTDLNDVVFGSEVGPVDKLRIIHHAIGQLQAIDQAGIVLFDRAGRNIRVLSSGSKGISTRQMDLDEFYDKTGGGYYNTGYSFNGPRVDYYEEMGFNLWGETAANLAALVTQSLEATNPDTGNRFQRKYSPLAWGEYDRHIRHGRKGQPNPLSSKDVLSILKQDIGKAIDKLDKRDVVI